MSSFDITAVRGDTIPLQVVIKRNNVAVPNLSTATLKCTARLLNTNGIVFQKTTDDGSIEVTNEPSGIVVVTIAPADTSSLDDGQNILKCDVELTESDGTVTTVAKGYLTIEEDQG